MIWLVLLLIFISLLTLGAVLFVYFFLPKFNFNLFRTSTFESQFEDEASIQIPFFQRGISGGQRAFVRCSSEKNVSILHKTFVGEKNCTLFKEYYGNTAVCKMACIGFGDCSAVCPQNAISIVNNTAVVSAACNGCGECVKVCPNGIIELLPRNSPIAIPCSSNCSGCSASCNGCEHCTEVSNNALFVYEGCVQIDASRLSKITNPDRVIKSCPRSVVKAFEQKTMKHFKLWDFFYNLIMLWEKYRRIM